MSTPDVVIAASGGANIASLQFALQRLGSHGEVSADAARIRAASHVILPGVGAAADAMLRLGQSGLADLIPRLTQPVLGICLGMQLLFERSEEHDGATGLGLLGGAVRRLRAPGLKLPHIGWSELRWRQATPLSEGLPDPAYLYHVHSFAPQPTEEDVVLATADYGEPFAAIVGRGNVFGTQSHPEKSDAPGLALLGHFTRRGGRATVPA